MIFFFPFCWVVSYRVVFFFSSGFFIFHIFLYHLFNSSLVSETLKRTRVISLWGRVTEQVEEQKQREVRGCTPSGQLACPTCQIQSGRVPRPCNQPSAKSGSFFCTRKTNLASREVVKWFLGPFWDLEIEKLTHFLECLISILSTKFTIITCLYTKVENPFKKKKKIEFSMMRVSKCSVTISTSALGMELVTHQGPNNAFGGAEIRWVGVASNSVPKDTQYSGGSRTEILEFWRSGEEIGPKSLESCSKKAPKRHLLRHLFSFFWKETPFYV